MGSIGVPEIILILVIALVVFGPRRLPEIGRTVGKSLREFRKASQDLRDEFQFSLDDDDEPPMVPSQPPARAEAPSKPKETGSEGQAPAPGPTPPRTGTKAPSARAKPAPRTETKPPTKTAPKKPERSA
jgi:sec-independent protein translocase protein TatA